MTPFLFPVRVYYEDTDSGGIVYHANYLKFFERARTEWLRARGFGQEALHREQRLLFMVRSLTVDFHQPARFDDLLEVSSVVTLSGGASLTFAQQVQRAGTEEKLCSAHVKVACVHADRLRPCRIPRALLREITSGP